MNVSLPTPLEEFIRHKVAAGEFHSADEVVCEGLRLLQRHGNWKADARAKIDAGWQQAKKGQLRTPAEVAERFASFTEHATFRLYWGSQPDGQPTLGCGLGAEK